MSGESWFTVRYLRLDHGKDWRDEENHSAEEQIHHDARNDELHNVARGSKVLFSVRAEEEVDDDRYE